MLGYALAIMNLCSQCSRTTHFCTRVEPGLQTLSQGDALALQCTCCCWRKVFDVPRQATLYVHLTQLLLGSLWRYWYSGIVTHAAVCAHTGHVLSWMRHCGALPQWPGLLRPVTGVDGFNYQHLPAGYLFRLMVSTLSPAFVCRVMCSFSAYQRNAWEVRVGTPGQSSHRVVQPCVCN